MDHDPLSEAITSFQTETDLLEKARQGFQIARYYHLNLYQLEVALEYFLQALQIAEELQNEQEISIICNGLGSLYAAMRDPQNAKETLQRAISLGESLQDDTLLPRPYINLGGVYSTEYNHLLALECYEKALKIAEKLGDQELIGLSVTSVGRIYTDIGEWEKSKQYNQQALNILPPEANQRFVCYINMAIAYMATKEFTQAIECYTKAIPLLEKVNFQAAVAEMHCHIAEALNNMKNYDRALEYALKAKKYVDDNQISDINVNIVITVVLLKIYIERGDDNEVEHCIQHFFSLDVKRADYLFNSYQSISSFYEKQGKSDLALLYYKKSQEAYKLATDEEMSKNLALKTANFEYEREKQKAELLKQKNEEMARYQQIIEQTNQELLKMHEEKDNLMNTISHDLKNYLGATQQALDIFTLKEKDMADNKYIRIVSTSTARSLNLVKEILYSTKLVTSGDGLSLQTVDLNKVISENEDSLLLRASKKGVKIVFLYTNEPLLVQLDSEKWHRIFENLTTNAIKFTCAGNDIHISTKKEGDYALISIKDSGIGIPPDSLEKLFIPFSGVGRKGTDGEESTGLGLSIVKKLVELHSGTIEVSSEVGVGTEFVVKLGLVFL